jgi:predicted transcriptional regulator
MRYRNRIDIIAHILEYVNSGAGHGDDNDGVTKTKIIYDVFLSYLQLKEYLTSIGRRLDRRVSKRTEK